MCKHQALVHKHFGSIFPNCPALTVIDRHILERLALGNAWSCIGVLGKHLLTLSKRKVSSMAQYFSIAAGSYLESDPSYRKDGHTDSFLVGLIANVTWSHRRNRATAQAFPVVVFFHSCENNAAGAI